MPDEQKDRWDKWIKTSEYIERLRVIEEHVKDLSNQTDISYYTPHDASHCLAVEKMVKTLIKKSKVRLSDLEKFILFGAVWTHDLGMFTKIATEFFNVQNTPTYSMQRMRDKHDEISAWYVSRESGAIMKTTLDKQGEESEAAVDNMLRNYAYTINVISQFHRMKTDLMDCPSERILKEEKIRTRLLAGLLRLGDTLHVDSSRFDRKLYNLLQIGQLDRTARLHWLKSYVVSNVYLDPERETVFINIDLPTFNKSSQSNEVDWEESRKNDLETVIRNGILEDVVAVSETFREYGMPAYSVVTPDVTYVPGYSEKDRNDVAGVINDLGIAMSPNTSKVIEKALGSIKSLCAFEFEVGGERYYTQMNQLIEHLRDMRVSRPCHVGLGKIIEDVGNVYKPLTGNHGGVTNEQVKNSQKDIVGAINKIKDTREECAQGLYDQCNGGLLNSFENIILFAYSETVINFLEKYGEHHHEWKEKLKLFVFECSGKRRFESNNGIGYNDGLYYAKQLSKHNFKKIQLLPDTSFGSLVYNFNNKCLFDLNEVSGTDRDKLSRYFKDDHNISLPESAKINKSGDGKTICISDDGNTYATITVDGADENATLKLSGGKTCNLTVKRENDKLNTYTNEIAKSLVLFGVNGISKESDDCGHSSGHLMIAIVANHYNIPVKIIADRFKIGEINWKPDAIRKTPWLTGQRHLIKDLEKHGIELKNYLEDKIPIELINEIIINGGNIRGGQVLPTNAGVK